MNGLPLAKRCSTRCLNILKLTTTVAAAIVQMAPSAPWRLKHFNMLNQMSTHNEKDQYKYAPAEYTFRPMTMVASTLGTALRASTSTQSAALPASIEPTSALNPTLLAGFRLKSLVASARDIPGSKAACNRAGREHIGA